MKQNSSRRRINEQARQVIAEIIMFEVADPRVAMVTVTGCEVSFDRSACNVYITSTPGTYDEALAALKNASGHIRTLMGKKLPWRTAPELRFFLDKSVDEAERIAKALANERARMDALKAEHEDEADSDAQADADGADAEEA